MNTSHRSPSQAICGGFLCTGIRCRDDLDTEHSGQRGKNLKGLSAVESISVLEAARQLGRSKNTVKYWVRKLPPGTVSKDESGRLRISPDGLEQLRARLAAEPDEEPPAQPQQPPKTGRKPPETGSEPDEKTVLAGRKPDEEPDENHQEPPETGRRTTQAEQLDALRDQLESLRGDLYAERERAAVAAAERDAERRRADAAELREQQQAQTVADLTAALRAAQQQAAELTAALATAQALQAGQIQLAMQQGDTAAQAAAVTAEPADDQPGDTRSKGEAREPAADQPGTQSGDGADDQSTGKRRGLFARLFGKR